MITENEGGMILLNNVACEKAVRIERNEPQANCVERILRAGFVARNMSKATGNAVQTLLQASGDGWDVSLHRHQDCRSALKTSARHV